MLVFVESPGLCRVSITLFNQHYCSSCCFGQGRWWSHWHRWGLTNRNITSYQYYEGYDSYVWWNRNRKEEVCYLIHWQVFTDAGWYCYCISSFGSMIQVVVSGWSQPAWQKLLDKIWSHTYVPCTSSYHSDWSRLPGRGAVGRVNRMSCAVGVVVCFTFFFTSFTGHFHVVNVTVQQKCRKNI